MHARYLEKPSFSGASSGNFGYIFENVDIAYIPLDLKSFSFVQI